VPGEGRLKAAVRKLSIAAAAAAAAGFACLAPDAERRPLDTAAPDAPGAAAQPESSTLPKRQPLGEQLGELFGSRTWTRPSPAAPAPARVEEPIAAPPNPYKVAGTLVQEGAKRVFLVKGERIYEARQDEDLGDGYKVVSIASDHVVLLYMPLGKKEQLPIATVLGADLPPASAHGGQAGAVAAAPGAPKRIDRDARAQLRWEGPERVRAGSSFTVALRVSFDQPLRATPLQLSFQPGVLEPVAVRAGKFFGGGSFSYRVNPDGAIFVGASGAGEAPGTDAELLVVTFRPIKPGATAEVRLSSVALQGAAGRALAHNQVSAFRTAIQ